MAVLSEMMDEVLDGRIPGGDVTREFEIQGDRTKYLRATVNTVKTETEKLLGLVAVIRDITSFREQEKEKEAFVAMLTHELRSPLGAVDTQLHVILKGLAGDLSEKQNHMLSRMRERVGNVLAMINDLLDLSKIESRKFAQEKTPMAVEPIIQDVIDLLGPQAQERGQTLDADLPESLPLVSADSHALREVVINLVSNALRYTPAGGRIRVGARADGPFVALTVEDNGLGIPKEYHDKIFERFFRVKDERARSVVGTGLGLPIVKAIVEDHGGALSLQSEVGRGSLFTVRLPVAG
jgi:signal transduction histidine kinase